MEHTVQDRRDLFDTLEHCIKGTYDQLVEEQELEYGQTMLKTFLIESNISPEELDERETDLFRSEIDYDLHKLRLNGGESGFGYYLDTEDDRFWKVFTLEKSSEAKHAIDSIIQSPNSGLDYTWFPIDFQTEISEFGEFRNLGISFDADELFPEEYIEESIDFGDLSLQGSGRGTEELYRTLQSNRSLRRFLALSAVGFKREVNDQFILERVSSKGIFTTRGGNSVRLHINTVDSIKEKYGDLVRRLEEDFRVRYPENEAGRTVKGSPVVIEFGTHLDDVEEFLNYVITSRNPLRLWGAKTKLQDGYWFVRGIDLHNNDKFSLEVSSDWLRLYLDEESCGNTALRIFWFLQHHFDSQSELILDA